MIILWTYRCNIPKRIFVKNTQIQEKKTLSTDIFYGPEILKLDQK